MSCIHLCSDSTGVNIQSSIFQTEKIEMEVLYYNKVFLISLGILTPRLAEPTNEFLSSKRAWLMIFLLLGPMVVGSCFRFYQYIDDFDKVIRPVLIIFAGLQSVGSFICMGIKMKATKRLFIELQAIVDKSNIHHIEYHFHLSRF